MDRALLTKYWSEAWTQGLWAASWEKTVGGLTAAQATTSPSPGRHSICQIVSHIAYWREVELRRARTGQEPTPDEIKKNNFPESGPLTEAAWQEVIGRLKSTHQQVAAAIADERVNFDKIVYLLPHDCYHFGQINYVRALLGLSPID